MLLRRVALCSCRCMTTTRCVRGETNGSALIHRQGGGAERGVQGRLKRKTRTQPSYNDHFSVSHTRTHEHTHNTRVACTVVTNPYPCREQDASEGKVQTNKGQLQTNIQIYGQPHRGRVETIIPSARRLRARCVIIYANRPAVFLHML